MVLVEKSIQDSGVYNAAYSKILHKLELCRTEEISMARKVKFKNEIIELLKGKK